MSAGWAGSLRNFIWKEAEEWTLGRGRLEWTTIGESLG